MNGKKIGQISALLSVKTLDLFCTRLNEYSDEDLLGLGSLLAESNINHIRIESNALNKFNLHQLEIITSILLKSKVNQIDFGETELSKLSLEQKEIISRLKGKFIEISDLKKPNQYDHSTFILLDALSQKCKKVFFWYARLSDCTDEQFSELTEIYAKVPLHELKINDDFNSWTEAKWILFSKLLKNPHLKILDFSNHDDLSKLNAEKWRWCGNALKEGHFHKLNLNEIDMENFFEDREKWQAFLYMLSCSPATTLDIGNNKLLQKITAEQWKELSAVIKKVHQLNVSGCGFADEYDISQTGWEAFCLMLKEANQLTEIDLSCNALHQLTLDQWLEFSACINSSIKKLILRTNGLSHLLPSMLCTNESINKVVKVIDLLDSKKDVKADDLNQNEQKLLLGKFTTALLFHTLGSVESVDLSFNRLDEWHPLAWLSLLEMIRQPTTKTCSIDFGHLGNSLSNENVQIINDILRICRKRQIISDPSHGGLKYLAANSVFHYQLLNNDENLKKLPDDAIELVRAERH